MDSEAARAQAEMREVAVSMIRQGSSAADVWQALVSRGMEPAGAEALVRELMPSQQQAQSQPPPVTNVYAPPAAMSDGDGWVQVKTGSFGWGFVSGFFCGCWAFAYSYMASNIGTETKRGIRMGFLTNCGLNVLFLVIQLIFIKTHLH